MSELSDSVDDLKDAVQGMSDDVCNGLQSIDNTVCRLDDHIYQVVVALEQVGRNAKM